MGTMATPSTKSYVAHPAPDDDCDDKTAGLTPKQEAFAQAWAKTGNKAAAYRMSYNVHERTLPNVVWVSASRLSMLPKIEARYKVLQQQAALDTLITVREALMWQLDIATANPDLLTRVVLRNCRYCRGVNHKYQWKNEEEFTDAMVQALDDKAVPPDDDGGYGFNGALEPVQECSSCFGVGVAQTIVCDTSKLTGKEAKLYAGVEQDRFGALKIKMHNQGEAWERVCRILGAFKDSLDLRTPAEREGRTELPKNLTPELMARAYLQLLN